MDTPICAICRDNLDPGNKENCLELSCKHVFHGNCIAQWFINNQKTCPYCKKDVFQQMTSPPPNPWPRILMRICDAVLRLFTLYSIVVLMHTLFTDGWPMDLYTLSVKFILLKAPLDCIEPWQLFGSNQISHIAGLAMSTLLSKIRCDILHNIVRHFMIHYMVISVIFIMIYNGMLNYKSPLDL
jgi:hypothetical protein